MIRLDVRALEVNMVRHERQAGNHRQLFLPIVTLGRLSVLMDPKKEAKDHVWTELQNRKWNPFSRAKDGLPFPCICL